MSVCIVIIPRDGLVCVHVCVCVCSCVRVRVCVCSNHVYVCDVCIGIYACILYM